MKHLKSSSRPTFGPSAGEQAGRIVDEAAELVGQVSLVLRQELAHFYTQQLSGEILHDGPYKTDRINK